MSVQGVVSRKRSISVNPLRVTERVKIADTARINEICLKAVVCEPCYVRVCSRKTYRNYLLNSRVRLRREKFCEEGKRKKAVSWLTGRRNPPYNYEPIKNYRIMKGYAYQPNRHFIYEEFEVKSRVIFPNGGKSDWSTRHFDNFQEAWEYRCWCKGNSREVEMRDVSTRRENCPAYKELGIYMNSIKIA